MNIFYVHKDPCVAAKMLCDKHVVKMTLETAQILSTVCGGPYKPTHQHHPSVVWAKSNIVWVHNHFVALLIEYKFRYGKNHKCQEIIPALLEKYKLAGVTSSGDEPPMCMPDGHKTHDVVQSYRNYYRKDKSSFAKWERGRKAPSWFTNNLP